MEYEVINSGHCTLLKQKDPKWKIKSFYIGIGFTTDPKSVLKFGPNGLHYTEHILYNVLAQNCDFFDGNASTYEDGTMTFYFIAEESTMKSNMTNFFKNFLSIFNPKNYPKLNFLYKREQRRVTSETSKMPDEDGVPLMFSRNPEIYMNKFPMEYVWNIILRECKLEKVLMMAHCDMSKEMTEYFASQSAKLSSEWDKRYEIEIPPTSIPYTTIAPPSMLGFKYMTKTKILEEEPTKEIHLSNIEDPVTRLIVLSTIENSSKASTENPYLFRVFLKGKVKEGLTVFDISPDKLEDQYYWSTYFLSMGDNVKAEHVHDLMNLDPKSMMKKYGKDAKKYISELKL